MQVRIREDSIEIDGYVNAVERKSRKMRDRFGPFIERICKNAFKNAIARNDNIRLLLNHDRNRDLGGTKDGNLELTEDNIGLHARARITDKEVIQKARNGDLVGWSFGFEDRPGGVDEHMEDGLRTRDVKDLNLFEVSLIDRTKTPAYEGTLVSVRSEDGTETYVNYGEPLFNDVVIRDDSQTRAEQPDTVEEKVIDYSKYENLIKEMKGE